MIANHANDWMIQIKRYLIQFLFIWADLQEFCQFIIFALLLEPFWYLLVTVALDQTICGLILEVQSCQYFYCKLGYWYLDLDLMDLHGLFLHCFSFTWFIRGKIYLLPQNNLKVKNSLERVKFFIQFGKWQEKTLKINVFMRFCKMPYTACTSNCWFGLKFS